jgi:hypothetical protein
MRLSETMIVVSESDVFNQGAQSWQVPHYIRISTSLVGNKGLRAEEIFLVTPQYLCLLWLRSLGKHDEHEYNGCRKSC